MNTTNRARIAFILLIPLLSVLFWICASQEAGQAAAAINSDNEGWSIILEPKDLHVNDLAQADDGDMLLIGSGYDAGVFGFTARVKPDGSIAKAERIYHTYFYNLKTTSDGGHLIMAEYGAYLLKLDNSGAIAWQKRYDQVHRFNDVVETADGGFIATGGTGSGNNSEGFALKVSSTGDVVWASKFFDMNLIETVVQTAGDRYWLFGYLYNSNTKIVEIDGDGVIYGQKTITPDSQEQRIHINKAVQTSDGNILVHAWGPWIAKLLPDGSIGWQYTYTSTKGQLQFNDMKALPNGNTVLVGLTEPYGPEPGADYENFTDGLAMEIDANGVPQWLRTYVLDEEVEVFESTAVDSQGDIYMAGYVDYGYEGGSNAWAVKLADKGQIARCPGVEEEEVTTTPTTYSMEVTGMSFIYTTANATTTDWSTEALEITPTKICPLPHLSLEKSGPQTAVGGVPFSYSLTITNNSDEALTGIEIRDRLPAGATYVSGGSLAGGEVVWDVGRLESGAQAIEQMTISAREDVTNVEYSVSCAEGYSTAGDEAVVTQIENLVHLPVINTDYCADFFDDFSDAASGWPVANKSEWRTRYVNGTYEMQIKVPGMLTILAPACARWYYVLEVDMEWESTPGPGLGLLFDISPDGRYFSTMTIDTFARTYEYHRFEPDGGSIQGEGSPFINPGRSKNNVRIIRTADRLFLEINGEPVEEFYVDEAKEKTYVGLVSMSSVESPSSTARFDNFSYAWSEAE